MCFFWGKKRKTEKNEDKQSEIEMVKLVTVCSPFEVGIVESVLKDNKIPYVLQETGANGYMKITTGALLVPTDIMVEKSYFEKAKSLTDIVINEAHDDEEYE